jgi:hypothetical protein
MLNKFYVLVDTESKIIIDKIQKLPLNWKNIAGLNNLQDKELSNLKWAGYHNIGWIAIQSEDIRNYSCSEENLNLNKNEFKKLISTIRKEHQDIPIEYQNIKIKCNIKTLYSLFLFQKKENVNYKCLNGYKTLTNSQINELYVIVEENIQKMFDWEMKVFFQIDKCKTIYDFLTVNYDI